MLKRIMAALLVVAAVIGLGACTKKTYEIALVTDVGTINDKSFNQGAWEGVVQYAEEFSVSYKYYQPDAKSTEEYIKSINVAIKNGAKVVVTPGFLFENAIWDVQSKNPNVKFILLDGSPHNVVDWATMATLDGKDPDFTVAKNTYPIFYAEEEAGFLAGYAAVKEGFTKLGFMGGMAVPAVVRFGYGFIEGANLAATEKYLANKAIEIKHTYLDSFAPDEGHQTKAAGWYTTGTEIIFACAGGAGNSVMKAAEQHEGGGKWVIGVDVNQKDESQRVITSSAKSLKRSVYDTLKAIYKDKKAGGVAVTLDAKVGGVELPDLSRFKNFKQADYDAIFARIVAGEFTITKDKNAQGKDVAVTDIVAPKVKVIVS